MHFFTFPHPLQVHDIGAVLLPLQMPNENAAPQVFPFPSKVNKDKTSCYEI